MEKWSFNSLLFSRLSDVLDISGTEIARRCGIKQQVFSRYTTNETVVSVQTLMKICNALRMPIHFFVSENDSHVIPNRESATIASDCWQPVGWDRQAVEDTFGDGEGRIYWRDVAKAMGVSEQKPHDRFLLVTRFPVTDFLTTCSRLGMSPFRFLIDANRRTANDRRQTAPPSPNESFRTEIADLHRKITDLSATVDDLTSKFSALLERHNLLENRFRTYLGDSLPLAADDPTEP